MLRAVATSSSGGGGSTAPVVYAIATVTTNTTLDATMFTVLSDDSGGNLLHGLPAAATCDGRLYCVKKLSAVNTTTIDPNGSELIDGASTLVLTTLNQNAWFQSNGTGWVVL